jgi:hypothetical protein
MNKVKRNLVVKSPFDSCYHNRNVKRRLDPIVYMKVKKNTVLTITRYFVILPAIVSAKLVLPYLRLLLNPTLNPPISICTLLKTQLLFFLLEDHMVGDTDDRFSLITMV